MILCRMIADLVHNPDGVHTLANEAATLRCDTSAHEAPSPGTYLWYGVTVGTIEE